MSYEQSLTELFGFAGKSTEERVLLARARQRQISYYYEKGLARYHCHGTCSYLHIDVTPWDAMRYCILFGKYVGNYGAVRCQECIAGFGDEFRFWKYEGAYNENTKS